MTSAVIFDVDGTLCDVSGVRHHVLRRPKDFAAFHAAAIDCPANPDVVEGVHDARRDGHAIVIVTARRARWGFATLLWLKEQGIEHDAMYMRNDRDDRKDIHVKADILRHLRRDGYDPVLAWDDNPAVIALWESEGIPVRLVPGWEHESRHADDQES